jgi:hypothetical protein
MSRALKRANFLTNPAKKETFYEKMLTIFAGLSAGETITN